LTNGQVTSAYLRDWSCKTDVADTPDSVIGKLWKASKEGTPFDIAIINLSSSAFSEEQLGEMIMGHPDLSHTKLIAMSAFGMRGDAARLKKSGYSAYLNKPVKKSYLYDCIRMVLDKRNTLSETNNRGIVTRFTVEESHLQPPPQIPALDILLAEDNTINRDVVRMMLERNGHRVTVAVDGMEVLQAFAQKQFDLVLMDIHMPIMDGFVTTREIRILEKNAAPGSRRQSRIPIIALSADVHTVDFQDGQEAEWDDRITKPVRHNDLLRAISQTMASCSIRPPSPAES
jgi:CheY-like chemotaxis protein